MRAVEEHADEHHAANDVSDGDRKEIPEDHLGEWHSRSKNRTCGMKELVHNDVLHAHRLERCDRKPAGQDFAGDALAHQGHGDAEADQPVGHDSPEKGKEEAHAAESLVFLFDVDLVESNDFLSHGVPDRWSDVVCRAVHGAAGQADGHDQCHNSGADPVADPHPDPVAERGGPGTFPCPCRHGKQGEVAGDQFHSEQNNAGEPEGEQQRADERKLGEDADCESKDHSQSKNGSGVEATDQQVLDADR